MCLVAQDTWGNFRFPEEIEQSANRFGFTGYLFDPETDFYYAKARYYQPEYGRFLTQDAFLGSFDEPPSLHRYLYANANPTRFFDPTGYESLEYYKNFGEAFVQDLFDNGPKRFVKIGEAAVEGAADLATEVAYQASDIAVLTYEVATGESTGYELRSGVAKNAAERMAAGDDLSDILVDTARDQGLNLVTAGLYGTGQEYYQTYQDFQAGELSIDALEDRLTTSAGNLVLNASLAAAGGRAARRSQTRAPNRAQQPAGAATGSTVVESMTQAPTRARVTAGRTQAAASRPRPRSNQPSGRAVPCRCFTADTEVATATGPVAIASISVGDEVWARDIETGKPRLANVTQLFNRVAKEIIVLTLASVTIQATPEHPFWVLGEGWVPAENLEVGDQVSTLEGQTRRLDGIERQGGEWLVYNFEVEGPHNYFVSSGQILVHNNPCDLPSRGSGLSRPTPRQVELHNQINFRGAVEGITENAAKASALAKGTPRTFGRFGTKAHQFFEGLNELYNQRIKALGFRVRTEEFRLGSPSPGIPGRVTTPRAAGSKGLDTVLEFNGRPRAGFDLKTGRGASSRRMKELARRFGIPIFEIFTR